MKNLHFVFIKNGQCTKNALHMKWNDKWKFANPNPDFRYQQIELFLDMFKAHYLTTGASYALFLADDAEPEDISSWRYITHLTSYKLARFDSLVQEVHLTIDVLIPLDKTNE